MASPLSDIGHSHHSHHHPHPHGPESTAAADAAFQEAQKWIEVSHRGGGGCAFTSLLHRCFVVTV